MIITCKHDDYIALHREITNKLHIPKMSQCIVKLLFTKCPVPLP